MEQQESADDAGGSTDAAPIGWLDEILPIDPDEDEYIPWCWDDLEARKPFTTRQDFEDVRNLVKRQIQYDDLLKNQWKYNRERLDEIVEIMVELHTTPEAAIRISGREWPAWAIQDRLKKAHLRFADDGILQPRPHEKRYPQHQELPDCYLDEHADYAGKPIYRRVSRTPCIMPCAAPWIPAYEYTRAYRDYKKAKRELYI